MLCSLTAVSPVGKTTSQSERCRQDQEWVHHLPVLEPEKQLNPRNKATENGNINETDTATQVVISPLQEIKTLNIFHENVDKQWLFHHNSNHYHSFCVDWKWRCRMDIKQNDSPTQTENSWHEHNVRLIKKTWWICEKTGHQSADMTLNLL